MGLSSSSRSNLMRMLGPAIAEMKTNLLEIQSYQTVSEMSPFVKSEVGMLLF